MRYFLFAMGFFVVTAAISTRADETNYPWCAQYSGGSMGGATNCGFTTIEQCMATVSGIGGFCNRNTTYVPPPGPHSVPQKKMRPS